jgi:urease accessory protein
VIARTAAVVEPGGVLGELACEPPLTLRQVRGGVAERCDLRLVGTAAGPLAADDLALSLRLRAGARATLRAAAASLAQGNGDDTGAGTLSIRADLGDGADLVADPGALIVSQGSRVDVRLELTLGTGVTLEWRELIVLGRTGEPAGAVTLRWDVTCSGRPVLRQFVDLADPAWATWAGLTAGRRVLACALLADPAGTPHTVVAAPTAVAQRLAGNLLLVTVLSDDAAAAAQELDELSARARG